MINLILTAVMIAALCGMVFCNRKHKKNAIRYQLMALGLLVVVIACGGMFMCRLDTLSMFGLDDHEELRTMNAQKFDEAKAHVVATYIKNNRPGKKKILLVADKSSNNFAGFLTSKLSDMNVANLVKETIAHDSGDEDKMISETAATAAEVSSIDSAIDKHKDAAVIILAGISPSGKALESLKLFKPGFGKRPQVIVLGPTILSRWVYDRIENEQIEALILPDMTRMVPVDLPENINEVFSCRYVLLNKNNLSRNKRFLH